MGVLVFDCLIVRRVTVVVAVVLIERVMVTVAVGVADVCVGVELLTRCVEVCVDICVEVCVDVAVPVVVGSVAVFSTVAVRVVVSEDLVRLTLCVSVASCECDLVATCVRDTVMFCVAVRRCVCVAVDKAGIGCSSINCSVVPPGRRSQQYCGPKFVEKQPPLVTHSTTPAAVPFRVVVHELGHDPMELQRKYCPDGVGGKLAKSQTPFP